MDLSPEIAFQFTAVCVREIVCGWCSALCESLSVSFEIFDPFTRCDAYNAKFLPIGLQKLLPIELNSSSEGNRGENREMNLDAGKGSKSYLSTYFHTE